MMASRSDHGFIKIIDSVAITGLKMRCTQYASLSQFASAENKWKQIKSMEGSEENLYYFIFVGVEFRSSDANYNGKAATNVQ